MIRTQPEVFDQTLQKTNTILKAIEDRFGWEDRGKSYLALRSVLHVLRDRLTVEHALGLGAQLPMLVRGFYLEGWKPSKTPIKMNRTEFIAEVVRQMVHLDEDPAEVIRGVLAVVASYTTPEEIRKIWKTLPKDIQEMLANTS